jgi:hypothetical protein
MQVSNPRPAHGLRSTWARWLLIFLAAALPLVGSAQDANVPFTVAHIDDRLNRSPLELLEMEQARPLIENDRSARVVLGGRDGELPLAAKWKPVHAPAHGFNNEPRYEIAADRLQRLFLNEQEYVVPPVVLRSQTVEEYRGLRPVAEPTIRGTNSVLFMLAFWVDSVTNSEPFRPALFEEDEIYARHWGNLNILTYLINHGDGNVGNLLISTVAENRRVFAVDNDIAFRSDISGQGAPWRLLRVNRLPASTIERLRRVTPEQLEAELAVLAEFTVENGILVAAAPGENLNPRSGVRITADRVQFGLTVQEIRDVARRQQQLLRRIERGRITTF